MTRELPAVWNTTRLQVRDANEADAAACCDIFNSCVRKTVRDPVFHRELSVEEARARVAANLEKAIPLPGPRMQVAMLEGRLIGMLEVAHGHIKSEEFPDVAWISLLAVHASVQGWGFGSELLQGLIAQFGTLERFQKVQSKVYVRNTPALQFLVNAGFHHIVNLGWEATPVVEPNVGIVLQRAL